MLLPFLFVFLVLAFALFLLEAREGTVPHPYLSKYWIS